MQPTEGFRIERRPLEVEDYIDLLRRHKGWVFGPFLLTLVLSVVIVYDFWPDSYESQATIMIKPQQIPENMVQSSVNQDLTERIQSMQAEILSRTVLESIILSLDLYKRERARLPLSDVSTMMQGKIHVLPAASSVATRNIAAFVVQFSYEDRIQAMKVVENLASKFVTQNIENRRGMATSSTKFLQNQADEAKKELDQVESQLTDFQIKNNGRLPDQVDSNLRQLQSLQSNATFLDNAISRSQQEKLTMETNVRIYNEQIAELSREPSAVAVQTKSDRLAEADRNIQGLENNLTSLRQRYRDSFPDVIVMKGLLEDAKKHREDILKDETDAKKETPAGQPVSPQNQREVRELNANVQRLESSIKVKDLEIDDFGKQRKRTQDAINSYQSKIETVPLGERQYGDLLRERDQAKAKYLDLDVRLNKAQISESMETSQQGELLQLLDAASLSQTPTEPKRPLIISIGAALGLVLGVVIAGAREMKDSSLKNLKDVRAYTQMSIMGSIPLLENDFVVRRRKRLAWLCWTTACLGATVAMAGSVAYYYTTLVKSY